MIGEPVFLATLELQRTQAWGFVGELWAHSEKEKNHVGNSCYVGREERRRRSVGLDLELSAGKRREIQLDV